MKTRIGFVSNSSSSSFVIRKEDLSVIQYEAIKNHRSSSAFKSKWLDQNDGWSITENDETIEGYTIMNNFDMYSYLESLRVDMDKVDFN